MFLPSCSGRLLLKELEMPPVRFPAALIAIALWMAPCLAGTLYAAGEAAPTGTAAHRQDAASGQAQANAGDEDWRNSFTATLARARALLEAGYERAPALVIALGAFVVLPAAAVFSLSVQSAVRRRRRRAAVQAAERRARAAGPDSDMPGNGDAPLWSSEAWLTVESSEHATLPLSNPLIRIGRHQDNDVRLPDTSVHRYHAVIERTSEEAFVIIDLSGKDGNGVRINGERQSRAQLADGDVIELGRTRLKFESAQA
jgi:FHA domain